MLPKHKHLIGFRDHNRELVLYRCETTKADLNIKGDTFSTKKQFIFVSENFPGREYTFYIFF